MACCKIRHYLAGVVGRAQRFGSSLVGLSTKQSGCVRNPLVVVKKVRLVHGQFLHGRQEVDLVGKNV